MEDEIRDNLGIALKNVKESFEISNVVSGSPASKAGIHKGDIILAIWGRSISYMSPIEVLEKLAAPGVMDIQMTFSRRIMVNLPNIGGSYENLLGAKLGFSEMDGLVVEELCPTGAASKAGVKKDDVVSGLQGRSTRYMPMNDVVRMINSGRGDTIFLQIKRDVVLWKKF